MIFCVLLSLLGMELALRALEPSLSGNLRHIHEIPTITAKIEGARSAFLFLGNSLTNNAIDPQVIQTSMPDSMAGNTVVEKITPDGTALSDWYCIYQNHISTLNTAPDVIVLGFAWAQLSDQYPIDPVRLGGLFCKTGDIRQLAYTGLGNHVNVLAFLAGAYSHVYLNREAIRNRVLDAIIPYYRNITQSMNQAPGANAEVQVTGKPVYTYETLGRFVHDMERHGTRLIAVAMPVQNDYEIDPTLVDVTKQHNIELLDMRHIPGIDDSMFADAIHLNEQGRLRFTAILSEKLARLE